MIVFEVIGVVEYTIAICNYNMAETLKESIFSVDELIDDRFEILVLDDGSTDRSYALLQELEEDIPRLRAVRSGLDTDGGMFSYIIPRRESIEQANGKYVIFQIDTDDEYYRGILDFVNIFHQIEDQVDFDPFLKGYNITMAKRELLLKEPHRHLGYHDDRDIWRRMIANGAFIGLHHRSLRRSLGYERDTRTKASVRFDALVSQFRSGITPSGYVRWLCHKLLEWRPSGGLSLPAIVFNLVLTPLAYLVARKRNIYQDIPPEYADIANASRVLSENIMKLSQIEKKYDINIDRDALSTEGREVFDLDSGERPGPRYWLNQRADIAANKFDDDHTPRAT